MENKVAKENAPLTRCLRTFWMPSGRKIGLLLQLRLEPTRSLLGVVCVLKSLAREKGVGLTPLQETEEQWLLIYAPVDVETVRISVFVFDCVLNGPHFRIL